MHLMLYDIIYNFLSCSIKNIDNTCIYYFLWIVSKKTDMNNTNNVPHLIFCGIFKCLLFSY